MTVKNSSSLRRKQTITSIAIALSALGLAYAPIPGLQQTVAIVSGTELQAPLQELATKFQQNNPNIKIELKFQGSQDIVNNYIDQKNEQKPTVLIPASSEFLDELRQRYTTQNNSDPFIESPQPIAKTLLVGVAWSERGKVLFPNGRFSWQRVEQAMQASNWQAIGGQKGWGSFDFMMTDPSRSNSGQVTLSLWSLSKFGGDNPNNINFSNPTVSSLFGTIKRSVYQPSRSTDILLQEFIARAPNDADVATVYESLALLRWQQSSKNQGKPYQIYYLDPTIETVATAAVLRQNVDTATASAAKSFISYIREPEQQKVFIQYGFRPAINGVNLQGVANSPWNQNIPGVELNPSVKAVPVPKAQVQAEIQRIWQRAN
ncbi:substrate-binding domain-containing protein [Scytonema sp. NUACC26]|uniref:substrate-binding domain-containing protein n=1 Tax=Scytonema sp. NUACC26 TaxID=3140176 RepID=UPI0034DC19C3